MNCRGKNTDEIAGTEGQSTCIGMAMYPGTCSDTGIRSQSSPISEEIAELDSTKQADAGSDQRYRAFIENSPIGIICVDKGGRILEVNRKMLEILGSPSAEATREINMLTFPLLVQAGVSQVFRRCMEEGIAVTSEVPYTSKWGKKSHLRIIATPMDAVDEGVPGCQAVMEDVTETKKAEEELRRELAVKEALAGLYVTLLSRNASLDHISRAVLAKLRSLTASNLGYITERDLNTGEMTIYWDTEALPSDGEAVGSSHINFQKEGLGQKITYHYSDDDRKPYFINASIRPPILEAYPERDISIERLISVPVAIGDKQVGQIGLANSERDYTESDLDAATRFADYYALAMQRYRSEKALSEAEAKYRTLVEQIPATIYIAALDQVGTKLYVSPQFETFVKLSAQDAHDRAAMWDRCLHHDDRERVLGELSNCFAEGRPFVSEYRMVAPDGSLVWLRDEAIPIRGADGSPLFYQGILRDITDRRLAEMEQQRLSKAVEQTAEAIVISDPDGTIQYVNPAFEKISGYSRTEVVGKNARILKSGEHDERFYKNLWDTITKGDVWRGSLINRTKAGTLYHEDVVISPVQDPSGQIVNYVAVKRDVTKEMEVQKQLLHAQKMEAVGSLAAGIAHDFNNVLTVVLGYSELLLSQRKELDSDYDDLKKIARSARNGADLVQRLLTFSRNVEADLRPTNLNNEVLRIEKMLSRTILKMVAIELHLADDLRPSNADPGQIEQVLLNLVLNANDAMHEGGTLVIETKNVELDQEYCSAHLEATTGDHVLLAVSDTGHGMEPAVLDRIFEPFFTTKQAGGGTGLGLAMVYGIVKRHGGHITCSSKPGEGTVFRIYFPAMPQEEPTQEKLAVREISRGGTETILLVEDEELIRNLGKRILSHEGYTVLTASNGMEGLEIYKERGTDIALVILDLIMPLMGGKQCLEEIQKFNPKVKFLIATGVPLDAQIEAGLDSGSRQTVGKPYDRRQMLEAIRNCLDSG